MESEAKARQASQNQNSSTYAFLCDNLMVNVLTH